MADSWMLTDTQMRDVAHKLNTDPWLIKPTPLQYLEAGALAQARVLLAEIEKHLKHDAPDLLAARVEEDGSTAWLLLDAGWFQQLKEEVNDG